MPLCCQDGRTNNDSSDRKERTMDFIALLTILVAGLVVFGILAITVGADSRDTLSDDWSGASRV